MIKLSTLTPHGKNPRILKDSRFKLLCQSLKDFPEMMELRPLIVDSEGVILGGNMRYKALKHLAYKEIPDEWVKSADSLTEEQKREFMIKDNASFGGWDASALEGFGTREEITGWGAEVEGWGDGGYPAEKHGKEAKNSEILAEDLPSAQTMKLTFSEPEIASVRRYLSSTGMSAEQALLKQAGYES